MVSEPFGFIPKVTDRFVLLDFPRNRNPALIPRYMVYQTLPAAYPIPRTMAYPIPRTTAYLIPRATVFIHRTTVLSLHRTTVFIPRATVFIPRATV